MAMAWPRSLVLAGAGKMGGALLRGWLDGGLQASNVYVIDPHLDADMRGRLVACGVSLERPPDAPEALILAIKPQTFSTALELFAALAGPGTLVVSILAGKTIAGLREGLPHAGAIVRAMPNLPAAIGRGASALAGELGLSPTRRDLASTLLGAVGHIEWLDESLIDAVTAVSGSGPAYVFYLAECLAEAGIAAGLPPDVAARLARATIEGAGALMAARPDETSARLREAVTSPGGTTAAALDVLMGAEGLAKPMARAVAAAKRRAEELADPQSRAKIDERSI